VPGSLVQVLDLSWHQSGRLLFYRGIYKNGQGPVVNGERLKESVFEARIIYGKSTGGPTHFVTQLKSRPLIPSNRHPGDVYWPTSSGFSLYVLRACCDTTGGRRLSHVEIGTIDPTTNYYSKIDDLDRLGINLHTCACGVVLGPPLSPRVTGNEVRWIHGGLPSWLIGDGRHLWWIGETGRIVEMPFPVTGGVGVPDQLTGP
jgi:hypothetical protein